MNEKGAIRVSCQSILEPVNSEIDLFVGDVGAGCEFTDDRLWVYVVCVGGSELAHGS